MPILLTENAIPAKIYRADFRHGAAVYRRGGKACQVCRSCRQALSENHPDIIRITHEKPNSIGVEDIRTQVNNDMGIKPYQGPYKVYLIEEAEK